MENSKKNKRLLEKFCCARQTFTSNPPTHLELAAETEHVGARGDPQHRVEGRAPAADVLEGHEDRLEVRPVRPIRFQLLGLDGPNT